MIRHIVFFTARDPKHLPEIRAGLETLGTIPHSTHFEVGENLHTDTLTGTEVDFVVYVEFETEADLAAYKAHPTYEEAIRRVRPLREMRVAADVVAR
ncbi:Dabb family protein [Roseovarius sp. B08]|uniref:Dabb family protein n=1 Tax=Roseovarius sp. B08 TaxID=3449223 RepID=UPI003EDC3B57